MVVGGDGLVLGERNEGGVDDDFHVGEEDRRRRVRGNWIDEGVEHTLVESDDDPPQHLVPVVDAHGDRGEPSPGRLAFDGASEV